MIIAALVCLTRLVVLEDGDAVVDEDGRLRCLEVGPEICGRPLHVDGRYLEADGLELGQEVQIHEVLLQFIQTSTYYFHLNLNLHHDKACSGQKQ